MKIGGLLENKGLTLYRVATQKDEPGAAGSILKFYAQRNINLEYITESSAMDGSAVIAICIKDEFVKEVNRFMEENKAAIENLKITKIEDVSTLSIYGPHFKEKDSIAARYCTLLGAAGVNILGISSSISSVCCIIKTNQIDLAKAAILKRFELP
jgi:aspartokinase